MGTTRGSVPDCPGSSSCFCSVFCPDAHAEPTLSLPEPRHGQHCAVRSQACPGWVWDGGEGVLEPRGDKQQSRSPRSGGDTAGTPESFGFRHTPCRSAGHTLPSGGGPARPAAESPPALPGYRPRGGFPGPGGAGRPLVSLPAGGSCLCSESGCETLCAGLGHSKAAGLQGPCGLGGSGRREGTLCPPAERRRVEHEAGTQRCPRQEHGIVQGRDGVCTGQ